jgi:hypothetical protein
MESKGRQWISMPQRMYEVEGVKKYFAYVSFDKEKQKKLEDEILPKFGKMLSSSSFNEEDSGLPF